MENLLRLIQRFHFFILFVIIELISFFLLIDNNNEKNRIFMNSANVVSGYFYKNFNFATEYLSLREENEKLAAENAQYRNSFKNSFKSNIVRRQEIKDSLYQQQYLYIYARVINNSVNNQYNYLTLDKGRKHGIRENMAVITTNGIVGVVRGVSDNFASVISIVNRKLGISAKIKKNDYFGSVVWDGKEYSKVKLKEIPNHVQIEIGDTVITSGFSIIFPEGIPIGTIQEFTQESGGNFYDITLNLTTNLKTLSYVYVVANLLKKEQLELENTINDD